MLEKILTKLNLKQYFKGKSEDFIAGYLAGLTTAKDLLEKDIREEEINNIKLHY